MCFLQQIILESEGISFEEKEKVKNIPMLPVETVSVLHAYTLKMTLINYHTADYTLNANKNEY